MVFKAATVHAAPVFMDKEASIDKAIDLIKKAGQEGIKLLVFPETFIPGYPYFIECYPPLAQVEALAQYTDASVEIDGPEVTRLQQVAKAAGVAVVMGISERMAETRTCFNSQVFIDVDGTLLGVHRKLQPTYAERKVWAQGGGYTLRTYKSSLGVLGGLACWEHTMNLARQALIMQSEQIHAAAWPGLSTMRGFEPVADIQIDAMMKTHALTAQCWVLSAGNPVDRTCLDWMEKNIGPQDYVTEGGGWSAVIHPFNSYLGGPHTGLEEKLVVGEINLDDLKFVKVWLDSKGHYARPEILKLGVNQKQIWPDEHLLARQDVTELLEADIIEYPLQLLQDRAQ
uniref:Nitrilase n=1 Tax=uncultured organism TaxID=155900 RepID=Q6RWI9_9ZZZZ|nr:nitrilase [uncultured organism]